MVNISTIKEMTLIWKSKLQTEISLSITQSEYTGVRNALCHIVKVNEVSWTSNQFDKSKGTLQGIWI